MSGELAGRLHLRVAIYRRATDRDPLGGAAGDWVAIGAAWAGIAPIGAGAMLAGEAPSAAPRWQVTLRAGADVTLGDRLVWHGRRLRVRQRLDDPAAPDRMVLDTEEER